jgi:hypothetical protein
MTKQPIRAAQAGQGSQNVRVACINQATVPLGKYSFDALTAALQKCYTQFFVPVWGYNLTLYNVPKGGKAKADEWQILYIDTADEAGALGYHDLTTKGQPVSKIFVKTTIADGEEVSVTACHEVFEMAIDPLANLWAQAPNGILHAYEMCDAVEEDTFLVDGIPMSNFLHPSYFEPFTHPKGTKYDHLGKLTAPFTMTKGGYQIHMKGGAVTEVFGSVEKRQRFAKSNRVGHRSEHRKALMGQPHRCIAPIASDA